MSRAVFLAAFVLSSQQLVAAQLNNEDNYIHEPLVTGDLVVWFFFTALHAVLLGFTSVPLFKLTSHRLPFLVLSLALLCTILQDTTEIGYIYATTGNQIKSIRTIAGLNTATAFFGDWSSPLLFLAIVLVLADRHAHIGRTAVPGAGIQSPSFLRYLSVAHYIMFAFLMILATVAAGLVARYNGWIIHLDSLTLPTLADIKRVVSNLKAATNSRYVFSAFWFTTAIYINALAFYIYKTMLRASLNDKILKITFFMTAPLYTLGIICNIIFTIVFSPAVLSSNGTLHQIQQADLANDVLVNFFFSCASAGVIVAGFKREHWGASVQETSLDDMVLFKNKARRYQELEESSITK